MRRPRPPSAARLANANAPPPLRVLSPKADSPPSSAFVAVAPTVSRPTSAALAASAKKGCLEVVSPAGRDRQQRPPSASPSGPDAASLILALTRATQRGEQSPSHSLHQCLAHVADLQFNAPEGISSLWKVAPVLRVAKDQLLEVNDTRQHLEAEVGNLRDRFFQLGRNVAAKIEELKRAEQSVAERVRVDLAAKQELDDAAAQLRQDIFRVGAECEVLTEEVGEGLSQEQALWAEERRQLLADIALLDEQVEIKNHRLHHILPELCLEQFEKISTETTRLKRFSPDAETKALITRRIVHQERTVNELQQQLDEVDGRKAARKQKLRGKRSSMKPKADNEAQRRTMKPKADAMEQIEEELQATLEPRGRKATLKASDVADMSAIHSLRAATEMFGQQDADHQEREQQEVRRPGKAKKSVAAPRRASGRKSVTEENAGMPADVEKKLQEIFKTCDLKGDNNINKIELIMSCRKSEDTAAFFGLSTTSNQEDDGKDKMELLFLAMDKDNDREVSWEEFKVFYSKQVFDKAPKEHREKILAIANK